MNQATQTRPPRVLKVVRVFATPAAMRALETAHGSEDGAYLWIDATLTRFKGGDWGMTSRATEPNEPDDWKLNDAATWDGSRIIAPYAVAGRPAELEALRTDAATDTVWLVADATEDEEGEAPRRVTIMLPSDC